MIPVNYIAQALRTEAPQRPIIGYAGTLEKIVETLIAAGSFADSVKKDLIYGKGTTLADAQNVIGELIHHAYRVEDTLTSAPRHPIEESVINKRLLHVALGLIGEAGELLQAMLHSSDTGEPIDRVNLVEEAGDCLWYQALLLDEVYDITGCNASGVAARNIEKLRKRFPDKFEVGLSNNRDLDAERRALEGEA